MTIVALDGPHWRFALRLYGQPGVAEACVLLQDRLGVDVNILLLSAYAAAECGLSLDARDVQSMNDIVAPWRCEVVAALRKVRRRMKSGPEPAPSAATEKLRIQIKSAELQAEQIEQAVLAAWLERHALGRRQSHVDIRCTLLTVIAYFASVHAASASAAGAGEVRDAMQTLQAAAMSTRTGSTKPTVSAVSSGND